MAPPMNKIKFVDNMDSLGLKTDNSKSNTYYYSDLFDNGSTLTNSQLTSLLKQPILLDHVNLYDTNQFARFLTPSNSAYLVKAFFRAERIRKPYLGKMNGNKTSSKEVDKKRCPWNAQKIFSYAFFDLNCYIWDS